MKQKAELENPVETKQVKKHHYNGLLEWILERDGHEFLVEVDREYIIDKFNHVGLCEKFVNDLNIPKDNMS